MIARAPVSDNDLLFANYVHDTLLLLNDSMATKHLKRVLALLSLQNEGYTFTHLAGLVPPGYITMAFLWKP